MRRPNQLELARPWWSLPTLARDRYLPRGIAWGGLARQCLFVTALLLVQLLLTHQWLDLIDEGYFADLADRVRRGELPYRDFATPYTPAIHYLHAWTFNLLGRDLVSLRLVLSIAKTAFAIVLYRLGRRVMPPAFALLPVVLVIAIDTVPLMWEPHPAWYALLWTLVTTLCIAKRIEERNDWLVVVAGVTAGLAFAFKQNLGVFVLIAAIGFLLHSEELPAGWARIPRAGWLDGWPLKLLRLSFSLLALAALTWLLSPFLEPRLALVLLLPVAALAIFGLATSPPANVRSNAAAILGRLLILGGAFLASLLAWGVPVVVSVGWTRLPWTQFFGALDLTGFFWELAEPRLGLGLFVVVAVAAPVAVQRFGRPASRLRRAFDAAILALLCLVAAHWALMHTADTTPDLASEDATTWNLLVLASDTALLYLPSLAFWGATLALLKAGPSLGRQARLTVVWYLVAGSLLFFNFYPRLDTMHVMFSGPLLFVTGAFALHRLYLAMTESAPLAAQRPSFRLAIFLSLLVLPLAAAIPNLDWRSKSLLSRDADGTLRFEPPEFVPIGLSGASVWTPTNSRDAIGGVVHYVQERTAPGEPIFVYPTLPMFYYLADRPNPTRFGHVYPAAATPSELGDMISAIAARGVRYVIWDQYWVDEWGRGDKHLLNKALTDYLLTNFHTETMIGPFHILVRTE